MEASANVEYYIVARNNDTYSKLDWALELIVDGSAVQSLIADGIFEKLAAKGGRMLQFADSIVEDIELRNQDNVPNKEIGNIKVKFETCKIIKSKPEPYEFSFKQSTISSCKDSLNTSLTSKTGVTKIKQSNLSAVAVDDISKLGTLQLIYKSRTWFKAVGIINEELPSLVRGFHSYGLRVNL